MITPLMNDPFFDDEFIFDDLDSEDDNFVFSNEDDFDEASSDSWRIMIVDDEIEVHDVTKLALQRFSFEDKNLSFISAYSGEEAKQLIQQYPDTALILLDVVMETNHAGLMVTKYIRDVLNNHGVRIILRTGQPGEAPEESVILDYDINDYKTKTELTHQKLFTTIISALRTYRHITTIEKKQQELIERHADRKRLNQQLQEEIAERKKLEAYRIEQERLRLQNEFLEKQSQELAKLNADKDKFFSIVAHDLKGPFQSLLGFSKLLLLMAPNADRSEIQEMSQRIHNSANNAANLLQNLLQWSRIQLGRMVCESQVLNLREHIEKNFSLLSSKAIKKRIIMQNLVSDDVFVYADPNMLDTVLRNLISNAIKFTNQGDRLTISAQQRDPLLEEAAEVDIQQLQISVADTGIGIQPEVVAQLLNINRHYSTRGTAEEQGSGLGLIICKEMVEKNGGQIWIESEVGKGTTVHFTLPIPKY